MSDMAITNCGRFISSYVKKVLRSELFLSIFGTDKLYSFKIPYDNAIDPEILFFNSILVDVEYSEVFDIRSQVSINVDEGGTIDLCISLRINDHDYDDTFEKITEEIESKIVTEIDHSAKIKKNILKLEDKTFASLTDAYSYYTSESVALPIISEFLSESSTGRELEEKILAYSKSIGNEVGNNFGGEDTQKFSKSIYEWMSYLSYLKFPMNSL